MEDTDTDKMCPGDKLMITDVLLKTMRLENVTFILYHVAQITIRLTTVVVTCLCSKR